MFQYLRDCNDERVSSYIFYSTWNNYMTVEMENSSA